MSTERASLWDWIEALVEALEDDPWGAAERLRDLVQGYTARIVLDDEAVLVTMPGRRLDRLPPSSAVPLDGSGSTTSAVVVAILERGLELTDAVERGLIQAQGSTEAVLRMFHAIELILDASSRVPALRLLADEFCRTAFEEAEGVLQQAASLVSGEEALLGRLGVANHR
jgi:hypothetical protein